MPSCLSGWPGKYKSSSVFYSPLPQISVKYSTLWAWFKFFFYPVRLQRELWIQCKELVIYCRAFLHYPSVSYMAMKYTNDPFIFILLGFLDRKTILFFLHWFLSRYRVLHTPFAKNLQKLLSFFLWHIHATAFLCYARYTNTDKRLHLNNHNTIYSLILFSLFTGR